jgi:hypothetical protein
MFERLKHRWALKNTAQVLMVLLVFALTGTTILVLKQPLLTLIFGDDPQPVWFSVLYYPIRALGLNKKLMKLSNFMLIKILCTILII